MLSIKRQPLERGVQARCYPRRALLIINPLLVPRHLEMEIVRQALHKIAGHDDLAPHAVPCRQRADLRLVTDVETG